MLGLESRRFAWEGDQVVGRGADYKEMKGLLV